MLEGNSTGYFFSGQDANSDNHDRKDVREIFEPIVSQVLELISKQVIEVLKSGKGPVAVNPRAYYRTYLYDQYLFLDG